MSAPEPAPPFAYTGSAGRYEVRRRRTAHYGRNRPIGWVSRWDDGQWHCTLAQGVLQATPRGIGATRDEAVHRALENAKQATR